MEEQSTTLLEGLSIENSFFSENINEGSFEFGRSLEEDFRVDEGNIIERLEIEDLTELRKFFFDKIKDETIKEPKGSTHPRFRGFKLSRDEFLSAIETIVGSSAYSPSANQLFDNISTAISEDHQAFIWWEQILDAIIKQQEEKQQVRAWSVIREPLTQIYALSHCKRETIVRVVPIETKTSFCYVMVSKYGRVGIYDWKISLLEQYEVKLGGPNGDSRRTTWLTDAVYLPDAATLVLAASDRSLHFFSASGLIHVPMFYISGLQNTPTCLYYTVAEKVNEFSMLLIGDDHGGITTMTFLQPQFCLFRRNKTDKLNKYFWKELESQQEWVTIKVEPQIHKDEVIKLEFLTENDSIISCSNDPNTTVVIRHSQGRRAPYIFKISRGVRCFHLDTTLKVLVTGSKDSVVRLWNPVMTNKPTASLFGHKGAVVDVRVLANLSAVLSMSKDATLKVWDINDETCLQSLPTLFPVFGNTGRIAEFGMLTFYPGKSSIEPPFEREQRTNRTLPVQKSHPASLLSGTSEIKQERISDSIESENESYNNEIVDKPSNIRSSEESNVLTETNETNEILPIPIEEPKNEEKLVCKVQWHRTKMLAVCCNFVALLYLGEGDLVDGEEFISAVPLPPPLREQDPAVPSPWLMADAPTHLLSGSHSLLSSSSSLTSPIPTPRLEYIRKSVGEDLLYEFKPVSSPKLALKVAKAQKYTSKKYVRALVEQGAPHLALNLSQLDEIKFVQVLPTSTKMKTLDVSNPEKLLKAKIKSESITSASTKQSRLSSDTGTIFNTKFSK